MLRWGTATLYGSVVRLRHWLFDVGVLPVARAPVPVLSVGGLEVGGSGKTPVTAYLIEKLREVGARPGLLSRGYGRQTRGVVVCAPDDQALPEQIGDEPAMLRSWFPNLPITVSARRARGVPPLIALGCDCIVLDDGFSHRWLARDLDIIVVRTDMQPNEARLLPLGRLREPTRSARRASLLWMHGRGGVDADPTFWPKQLGFRDWVHSSVHHTLHHPSDPSASPPKHPLLVCGIANPDRFLSSARQVVDAVENPICFPDHERYGPNAVRQIECAVDANNADALVTTEKDWTKLKTRQLSVPIWSLRQRLSVIAPNDLDNSALRGFFSTVAKNAVR